jgi:excinuclease ABC subunit C
MTSSAIQEKLNVLPTRPGVYLMKDARGRIIYVGKAVNLRNRVRSYFHASALENPKTCRLVAEIADLEFIVTESELEALILECNLIKQHRPRFNVRLKDDKRYPYIKVAWQDDFPRVLVTRQMKRDGARYYGPYTSAWAVRQTLDMLRPIFPYLTCTRKITGEDRRACLYYHIKRCAGPCIGEIDRADYRALIQNLCDFLDGRTEEVLTNLRRRMEQAAERLEFEKAALYRDQIRAAERVTEQQRIVSGTYEDQDVLAFARDDGDACVQVFFIRGGKLIGREHFILEGADAENDSTVMGSFLKQFYDSTPYVPPEILLSTETEEAVIIEQWLRSKRGTKVALRVPHRGHRKDLVSLAAENAAETLSFLRAQWQADESKQTEALTQLQEHLGLPAAPARIECYDISNIQGESAVGSMVVFAKGVPRKSDYRRFRIRTVRGADDYASMQEVLRRRFLRWQENDSAKLMAGRSGAWSLLPDLIIVDGGKGQLNAALHVVDEFDLRERVPVVALAKRQEEVFLPGKSDPVQLPERSPALFLIQRVRDEAHRFAVGYHRTLRRRRGLASTLEEIPGIGPARRRALLKQFGSLEAIRQASVDELAAAPRMTRKAAEAIKEML